MRRFYGPRHLLSVVLNILCFPGLVFRLHKLSDGWRRWSGRWWTSIYRAGGWLLLRRWAAAFRKDGFPDKLAEAKKKCAP
jgi:hypothetical protein